MASLTWNYGMENNNNIQMYCKLYLVQANEFHIIFNEARYFFLVTKKYVSIVIYTCIWDVYIGLM